jgi:hypothetical protein
MLLSTLLFAGQQAVKNPTDMLFEVQSICKRYSCGGSKQKK